MSRLSILSFVLLFLLSACAKRPAAPPAPEPSAVVIVAGTSESMPVKDDPIPSPRLNSPAAEPVMEDDPEAMEIFAIAAENGVWNFQHANGRKERNELHLPVGRSVKFALTSEVEGPLFGYGWQHLEIPAFPFAAHAWAGRWTGEAVRPLRVGTYGLRNAHEQIGTVFVMDTLAFDRWL